MICLSGLRQPAIRPAAPQDVRVLPSDAEQNGLAYAWEGTAAFAKRMRYLKPEQYQLMAVHTHRGMTRVLLFSKSILRAPLPRPWVS